MYWQAVYKLLIVSSLILELLEIERSPCIMTDCRYFWKNSVRQKVVGVNMAKKENIIFDKLTYKFHQF